MDESYELEKNRFEHSVALANLGAQKEISESYKKLVAIEEKRDRREGWLFWIAIASLFVSGGSLYVAALALHWALVAK
jgi:hypothetical protein